MAQKMERKMASIEPTRIAVCQIKVIAKRPDLNTKTMLDCIELAAANKAEIVVFSEQCISGYLVGDDWEDVAFVEDCVSYTNLIQDKADELEVTVVFGNVTLPKWFGHTEPVYAEDGREMRYNSVIAAVPEHPSPFVYNKINLPVYREFDDKRYFQHGRDNHADITNNKSVVTVSVCEDGWDDDYDKKPIKQAAVVARRDAYKYGLTNIHLNLSCSPFTLGKNSARHKRFTQHSKDFDVLLYVNNVGAQNNGKNVFVFDGCSSVYSRGEFLASLPPLQDCIGYLTVQGNVIELDPSSPWSIKHQEPTKQEVLAYGIREFCGQNKIKRAVIGLSGGIDSALSAMLHVKALGKDNVIAVNMPTKYNSETTKGIAKTIADNLGVRYLVIPINEVVNTLTSNVADSLAEASAAGGFWYDMENVQARMRGAGVQAMLAAGFGAVFPNNGNKAEAAVGYCTMLGDMAGYLAPIADLWKHEVYETAQALSDELGGVLPNSIFEIKPSAELSDSQNIDQGKGDPITYWYHDKLFQSWIEPWNRLNIETTLSKYIEGSLLLSLGLPGKLQEFKSLFPTDEAFVTDLEYWWKQFKGMGTVKRVQAPPVLVVSRRAFGFDFRESIGMPCFTRKYSAMKARLLNSK